MLVAGNRRYVPPKEESRLEEKERGVQKDEEQLQDDRKEEQEIINDNDSKGPIEIKHLGSLEGWDHSQSEEVRHEHIRQSIRDNGKAKTEKKLTTLTVLDKNRDPAVARAAQADLECVRREFWTGV